MFDVGKPLINVDISVSGVNAVEYTVEHAWVDHSIGSTEVNGTKIEPLNEKNLPHKSKIVHFSGMSSSVYEEPTPLVQS